MSQAVTFGIVGGYGATGRAVAAELRTSDDYAVLIAGRDLEKANAIAAQLGDRVSAARVDVTDPESLDALCGRCSLVINCAGPVMMLRDRVAQAALRQRCHYVDVAGLSLVREALQGREREITEAGLSYVISAGWLPGLTEVLPLYAYAIAKSRFDCVGSVTLYVGDSGEWSENAIRDAAWFVHKSGLPGTPCFRNGELTRASMADSMCRVSLPEPIGTRRFSLYLTAEQATVGHSLRDCAFSSYSYLPRFRTALVGAAVALLPLPESLQVRLLRGALRAESLPVGGFAVAQVRGQKDGSAVLLSAQVTFDRDRGYWLNGLVAATMARYVADGKVRPGLRYLAEAVDAAGFVATLKSAGVQQTECVEAETRSVSAGGD